MEKTNDKILERIIFWTAIIGRIIYNIRKDFNVHFFINLWHSIVEYKYRILFVILINLIIIIWISLPYKKPRIIHIFLHFWWLIVFILCLLYPFTANFKNRFWIISNTNVSDFYAAILPIFIMLFFYATTSEPWDYKRDSEEKAKIKSTLSKKLSPYKRNKISNFVFIILFSFLFAGLTMWICLIRKVNPDFQELFIKYPTLIFVISITISWYFTKSKRTEWDTTNTIKNQIKSKKTKKHQNMPNIKQKLK
jgi:hypothetical protein